jgi:hypothetical protein
MKGVRFLAVMLACTWPAADLLAQIEPPYPTLPDPLVTASGQKIVSVEAWENIRRPEILRLFTEQIYGRSPGPGEYQSSAEVIETTPISTGKRKTVRLKITGPNGSLNIDAHVYLPDSSKGPVPVFLYLNGSPLVPEQMTGRRFPLNDLLFPRGYGGAVLGRNLAAPDNPETYRDGVIRLFNLTGDDAWEAISCWAWTASRLVDYLLTDPEVDPNRIAVIGNSRAGKTALWCAAQDQRIALVAPNDSGLTGVSLARRMALRTIDDTEKDFPHWFCQNYAQYRKNENKLPVDQHQLLALIAPRLLAIGNDAQDYWCSPRSEFYSIVYAQPVFKLYEALKTEWSIADFPASNTVVMDNGNIHYHMEDDKHDLTPWDWEQYLNYADKMWPRPAL